MTRSSFLFAAFLCACGARPSLPAPALETSTASLTVSDGSGSLTVFSPSSGATVSSPVTVSASCSANSGFSLASMQVYWDNTSSPWTQDFPGTGSGTISPSFTLSDGGHTFIVKCWFNGASGALATTNIGITVGSSGGGATFTDADGTLTVSSPADGASVSSPVTVNASCSANSGRSVASMQVYWDNTSSPWTQQFSAVPSATISQAFSEASGPHTLIVKCWFNGASGALASTSFSLTVGGSCTPATCQSLGDNCGNPDDGCGGKLSCGSCTSPQSCGGGGTPFVCGGGGSSCGDPAGITWPCNAQGIVPNLDDAAISPQDVNSGCGTSQGNGSNWNPGNSVPPPGATESCSLAHFSSGIGDGSGIRGTLGFSHYGSALWWQNIGDLRTATHAVYDTYVQISSESVAQAIEIDINQFGSGGAGDYRLVYGTQCDIVYRHHNWEVWNGASGSWVETSVPCTITQPDRWYHVQFSFTRLDSNGNYTPSQIFVRDMATGQIVTPLTNVSVPDGSLPPEPKKSLGSDSVDFQMDGISTSGTYTMSLEGLQVIRW